MNPLSSLTAAHPLTLQILILFALVTGPLVQAFAAENGAKPAIPSADVLGKAISTSTAETTKRIQKDSNADFPNLMESIRRKEKELGEREQRVREAEQRNSAALAILEEKRREFDEARKKLEDAYALADKNRLKRIKALSPAYEGMKPENAATAMAGLDTKQALTLLEVMDTKKVAKILDSLVTVDKEKAIALTKELQAIAPKPAGTSASSSQPSK
ncbi:MAG: hypothetical protein NTX50_12155 [Candidatus Sumerlaeota bacterium]|nr:hypothetical protein [Candidatus Sumerlaeota bacterium]